MPFQELQNFIQNNLADNVADYLNAKSANFPNVGDYYAQGNNYFNESTVQSAMFQCINTWITAGVENHNHFLIRTEVLYPGFNNIADLWITYNNGAGASNIAIELKTDFIAHSVNEDIELLDAIDGVVNPVFNSAYAFYTVQVGHNGWTDYIDDPVGQNVMSIPISVIF